MKPQVLTTMTSASSGSSTTRQPSRPATPSITSVSTRFLTQPRLTKWILRSAIERAGLRSTGRRSSPAHEVEEATEHVEGVVRAGGGLGVVLGAEGAQPVDGQALGGAVV